MVTPLQNMVAAHRALIEQFPHRTADLAPDDAGLTAHD
jgi:hypothetical protein